MKPDNNFLFIDSSGKQMKSGLLNGAVRKHIKTANIGKSGSCHLFRHAMATHMLNHGASVRYVQQMLGHESIETTKIYTHVSIPKLKEIHAATMPQVPLNGELKESVSTKGIINRQQGVRPKVSSLVGEPSQTIAALRKTDTGSLTFLLQKYLDSLTIRAYSKFTIEKKKINLDKFILWCSEKEFWQPKHICRDVVEEYQIVFQEKKHFRTGKPLSPRTLSKMIESLQGFFQWLYKNNHILYNPTTEMLYPRFVRSLPGNVLSKEEVEIIFKQPNTTTPVGLRDRAILEVLYSTGMRRSEIASLETADVHFNDHTLFIKDGKGNKDRYVPVGESTLLWLKKYISESRQKFLKDVSSPYLFVSNNGDKLSEVYLGNQVSGYVKKADIGKQGGCLLFRHTTATTMLENGADIRFIQQMLGHSDLKTTELYTHVSITKLKEVHAKTHPRSNLKEKRKNL